MTWKLKLGRQIARTKTSWTPKRANVIQNGEAQSCSGAAETLAFHAALAASCLASDRGPPVRNAPARRAKFPSRVRSPSSTPSQRSEHRRSTKPLCPANRVFLAYLASYHSSASAPQAPRWLSPAGAMQHLNGKRPRRCLAAAWSRRETRLPLLAIERSWRRPDRVPNGRQAGRGAGAAPHDILFRLEAFDAGQSSFRRAPDVRARSPDGRREAYRWRPWRGVHWRGRDSRANRGRRGV